MCGGMTPTRRPVLIRPILTRQCDHARDRGQADRAALFDGLISRIESQPHDSDHRITPILSSALSASHDVVSLGVSARRGPVLWSHVLDVRRCDCPFVAALLTFEGFDGR